MRVSSATKRRDILSGIQVIAAAAGYALYGAQHYLANYVRHPRYPIAPTRAPEARKQFQVSPGRARLDDVASARVSGELTV